MKKLIYLAIAGVFAGQTAMAQPIFDNAVIPVAVNLNQILRIHITQGGNIEFVFSTIDQYKSGINNLCGGLENIYETDFGIASSSNWQLDWGAEDAQFVSVDNTSNVAFALNNVGISIEETGGYTAAGGELLCAGATVCAVGVCGGTPLALTQYGVGSSLISAGASGNGGDAFNDNSFIIHWRCGTGEGNMNATSIISQTLAAERYITNVIFHLNAL